MESIDEKVYARAEIWKCLSILRAQVKETQKKETLSENTTAIFEQIEQITASLREYFTADEAFDLERDPTVVAYIRDGLQQSSPLH
jgi:hypothetical protein